MDLFDEKDTQGDRLFGLLQSLTFETNFFKRIQGLEVIFGMIDDELGNRVNLTEFKEFLIEYTEDKNFMRKTRLISTIEDTPETAIELYGFDYISNPDFQYDEDFMVKRRNIEKRINMFIGELMRESANGEDGNMFDYE